MTQQQTRTLTTLEYVILGFLAAEPRSGYAIISRLESGTYRWSSSAGSIYPVLKRLEKQGIISSQIEAVYETRPRKVYSLLPLGEQLLDDWLKQAPTMQDVIEDYDIALHRFIIAEFRLTRQEVLDWLCAYETVVSAASAANRVLREATGKLMSVHAQLADESIALEIQARLEWIRLARERLSSESQDNQQAKPTE